MKEFMTYESSGVNYNALDPFKRAAMAEAGRVTSSFKHSPYGDLCTELEWSRGESAYLCEIAGGPILAFVIEGLGSANKIAEDKALRQRCGKTFYYEMAITNAAMSFNDMITVGAMPLTFALHPAVESGEHLSGKNGEDLIAGTAAACLQAGCLFGPGETPALRNIIVPGTMCLSGAAMGIVRDPSHLMRTSNVRPGLRIVMLGSTGLHGNGYTLARRVAETLPEGYLTDIGNGMLYGEALMQSTALYVEFTRMCQDANVAKLVYGVNITGHGWRKLMRAPQPLTYVIEKVQDIPDVFQFIMERGPVTLEEMYKTYNMGAGYAVFVEPDDVEGVLTVAEFCGIPAWDAGRIEEGDRKVVIEPHNLTFSELDLR